MNARILRKWSIHTKNLMSCSVCSLVVVVLLLLVTCAPSLTLATMNFRSDAPIAANPTHMPKNAIKEATFSSSSSPILLTSLYSSLSNRNHRLASSTGVEVVETVDTKRESFPGYYKNYHTDDTQPLPTEYSSYISSTNVGSSSSRSSSTSSSSSSSKSGHKELISANIRNRHNFIENKKQFPNTPSNTNTLNNNRSNNENIAHMRWPKTWFRHHSPTLYIPPKIDDLFNDDIKQLYNDKANDDAIYDNLKLENDNESVDRKFLYLRNDDGPQQIPAATTISKQNFPVQQYILTNNRRTEDDSTNHVAPSPLTLRTITPIKNHSQLQRTLRTASAAATHLKQPELIHSNNINNLRNVKNIFPTTHNKSAVEPVPVPVPVTVPMPVPVPAPSKEDNIFVIDRSNLNKIKLSGLPLHIIIESYEVPASLPLTKTLTEKQRRMLIHEQHLRQLRTIQQQAARSRRESLRNRYKKYENGVLTPSSLSSSLSATTDLRISPSLHNLRQHQHQQRTRKHSRRYCSAKDPAQLAFEAPTVFEGKIVSMTPDRRQNFSATVEVKEVFKQQIGFRLQKYLRLQFAYRNSSGECDIYREELRPRGLIRGDTIEPGRLYFLFVQQIDIGNFTILGQPIRKTKRVVEAVRYAVSGNYAQLASIKSISASNRSVENGQELRIICKVTGRPPPKVTWFKDHRSINRNRKLYQFSHYKKRSELIIRSFNTSDAGRYECRAKNKVNRNVERRAIVIKAFPVQRFDPNLRGAGHICPEDAAEFCFNGGTCKFFSEIGSYSCICPEGFIGERCDRKEVNNVPPSTYSNEHECGEKKYLGSYYC